MYNQHTINSIVNVKQYTCILNKSACSIVTNINLPVITKSIDLAKNISK